MNDSEEYSGQGIFQRMFFFFSPLRIEYCSSVGRNTDHWVQLPEIFTTNEKLKHSTEGII